MSHVGPNAHVGPLICLICILGCLLQNAMCAPVDDSCWDCLAERSSLFTASDPVLNSLTNCNYHNFSADMALLSTHNFDSAFLDQYSICRVFCGDGLQPLLLGEAFDVSARAIMKCALRSLNKPSVAYLLRAHSLRCMLVALRVRRPHIRPLATPAFYRDAVVYLGPPHQTDLRGKRGLGNWAEFKLSLQVASFGCLLLAFFVCNCNVDLAAFEVLLAVCSPGIARDSARIIQRCGQARVAKCR